MLGTKRIRNLSSSGRASESEESSRANNSPSFPVLSLGPAEMNASTYLKILKTDGVVGFFRNNGRPVIIPDEQVDDIKNGKDINLFPNSKEDIKVSVVKRHQ